MSEHVLRITIDVDATLPAEEIDGIVVSVGEKLSRCWADTTTGPIHDADGKHVANAKVEQIPLSLQIAAEYRATHPLLTEARQVLAAWVKWSCGQEGTSPFQRARALIARIDAEGL